MAAYISGRGCIDVLFLESLGFTKVDNSNLHLMGGLNIRSADIFISINVGI